MKRQRAVARQQCRNGNERGKAVHRVRLMLDDRNREGAQAINERQMSAATRADS